MTTYSFAALLDKMGNPTPGPGSRSLGISGESFKRYTAQGLNADQADRLAVRLGFHPLEIWPDWELEPPAYDASCPECDEGFFRSRWNQVYCSKRCKDLVNARRWRRGNAEFQRRERERVRRYRAEVRELQARRSA